MLSQTFISATAFRNIEFNWAIFFILSFLSPGLLSNVAEDSQHERKRTLERCYI